MDKSDLVHGEYYSGQCRNATVARWNAEHQCFIHWRTKFGFTFLETIKHPDDDQVYDVFLVEKRIDPPEKEIPLELPA